MFLCYFIVYIYCSLTFYQILSICLSVCDHSSPGSVMPYFKAYHCQEFNVTFLTQELTWVRVMLQLSNQSRFPSVPGEWVPHVYFSRYQHFSSSYEAHSTLGSISPLQSMWQPHKSLPVHYSHIQNSTSCSVTPLHSQCHSLTVARVTFNVVLLYTLTAFYSLILKSNYHECSTFKVRFHA